MNGNGSGREVDEAEKTEEAKEMVVLMCGYLPGASTDRSSLLSPVAVRFPAENLSNDSWNDVCCGGCGFAVAISESGKLMTWGCTDDQGQSYLTSGMHEETPEPFLLPTKAPIVKAAAGWAHCTSITDAGEVYTWGWKECVPTGKVALESATGGSFRKDIFGMQCPIPTKQVSPQPHASKSTGKTASHPEDKRHEEGMKRRKILSSKQELENSISAVETLSVPPCLVALDPGVRITSVAAGGRHTLALSDVGQVWAWGYGGEGQLGLGSRIKMVSSPHLIPCFEPSSYGKDGSLLVPQDSKHLATQAPKFPGSYIKSIACGGRHSAAITDAGALLTFGWGLYGQCGLGSTNDVLKPTYVSSLSGGPIKGVAAGLWHTLCISVEGNVHAFGGNQFGQLGLGTGADDAEVLPRLLDGSLSARVVSCGARHSAVLTEDGKVYCWGWNKYGQLGLGDAIDRNIPSQAAIDDDGQAKNIACGWWHTLLLVEAPS